MNRSPVVEGGEVDPNTGLWKHAPKKIAFIHYGKCAGVYTQKYLRDFVIPKLPQFNSWWDFSQKKPKRNLHRDWTKEELLEIATKNIESGFAHNHMINWCPETIKAFNDNGWFTFTFLRDPKDIICSLYSWSKSQRKRHDAEDLANPLRKEIESMSGQSDPRKVSLDTFFNFLITDKDARNLWTLPDYIDEINYVAEFNDNNFKNFLLNYFHHEYVPAEKANASGSKGYQFYYNSGEISEATKKRLEKDADYRKYDKFLTRGFETMNEPIKRINLDYKAKVKAINVEGLKSHLKPFVDLIKESGSKYFWIASGAIRDYFVTGGMTPKDIDIFFPNTKERDKAINYLKWKQFKVISELPRDRGAVFDLTTKGVPEEYGHLAQGANYKYHSMDIGCWDGKSGDPTCYAITPQECISWFDFTIEMAALDSEGEFFCYPTFENDITNKILIRNSIRDAYPRGNNKRLLKYIKNGFSINNENLLQWLEDQEATFTYRKKLKNKK